MESLALPESTIRLLLDAALRGLIILMGAVVLYLCLRRSAAAWRHLVLSLATIALVVVPGLTALLPGWQLPAPVAWLSDARQPVEPHQMEFAAPIPDEQSGEPTTHATERPTRVVEPTSSSVVPAAAAGGAVNPSAGDSRPRVRPGVESVPRFAQVIHWLPAVWLAGVVVVLFPSLVGFVHLWRVGRRSHPVEERGWNELLSRLWSDVGQRRRIRLRQSSIVSIPMTWGMFRPVILLPDDALTWPTSRRRVVLLHELAHIKRFDWVTNLIAEFARALHWFNPLAWILVRQLHVEGERACDDLVLREGTMAGDYAAELLHFVNRLRTRPSLGLRAVSIARRSSFEQRIVGILDATRSRTQAGALTIVAAFFVCLAVLAPLAMVRLFDSVAVGAEPAAAAVADDQREARAEPDTPVEQTTTETRDTPRRGVAATEEQLRLPFGPALANGLRVAWVIEPTQDAFVEGDLLLPRLFFHNAGDETLQFKRLHEFENDRVHVRFSDGRETHVPGIMFLLHGPRSWLTARLEPGEIIETGCDSLVIRDSDTTAMLWGLPVSAGESIKAWIDVPLPEFQLPPETAPRPGRLASAPLPIQVTDGEPNTTVRVHSAVDPGGYAFAEGIRLQIRKDVDADNSPVNAVTIQWFDDNSEEPAKEQTINVPALDREFGVAWGEGRGAFRRSEAYRFWIAKANAVQLIAIHSPEDVRVENFGWSLHENFGKDVYEESTLSANYGGIPAVVMSRLESLRPQQPAFALPDSDLLRGLDLSEVPVRTYWDTLRNTPELFVPDPDQPGSWTGADDIFGIPLEEQVWVKYLFRANRFYVDYRPDDSWENEQTYGPIDGNPFERLELEEHLKAQLRSGGMGGDAPYRLRRMFRTGSEELIRRASGMIAMELEGVSNNDQRRLFVAITLLEAAREALRNQADEFASPQLQPDLERLRTAMARAERMIDEINDSVPDERYQSVTYLQEQYELAIPEQLWGQPVDGLRIALVPKLTTPRFPSYATTAPMNLESMPTVITVSIGHQLEVELLVENVSEQEIKLSGYVTSEVGRFVDVRDSEGQRAETGGMYTTIKPILHFWRLNPGERYLLRMPTVHFVRDSPIWNPVSMWGSHVRVASGEHTLGCRFRFGRLDNTRHRHVPVQSEWIGELSTGVLKLNVAEPQ